MSGSLYFDSSIVHVFCLLNFLYKVILVIVIGYGALRTTKKGIRKFKSERAQRSSKSNDSMSSVSQIELVELSAINDENETKDAINDENETKEEQKEYYAKSMLVSTQMGPGKLLETRPDGSYVVELDWTLANSGKVIMYTQSLKQLDRVELFAQQQQSLKQVIQVKEEDLEGRKIAAAAFAVAAAEDLETVTRRKSIMEKEKIQGPRLLMIMGMLLLIVLLSLVRGGKAGSASVVGIQACSGGYWGVTAFLFLVLVGLAVVVGGVLSKQYQSKVECDYNFVEGDIKWTGRNVYLYPALSGFAGLCGGLLGIGGGMVMGPLLLELGMLPQQQQATSATTVLITSGAAMFQFLFLGMLIPDYGLFFACLGLVATFFGQTFLDYLVKKYNTTSFIVFSIALVMIIAVILMAIAGIIRIVGEIENGTGGGFTALC